MTSLIAKQGVFKMLSKDIASCILLLKSYNKYVNNCLTESDYPQSIRYLPLYTLGLLIIFYHFEYHFRMSFLNNKRFAIIW